MPGTILEAGIEQWKRKRKKKNSKALVLIELTLYGGNKLNESNKANVVKYKQLSNLGKDNSGILCSIISTFLC